MKFIKKTGRSEKELKVYLTSAQNFNCSELCYVAVI